MYIHSKEKRSKELAFCRMVFIMGSMLYPLLPEQLKIFVDTKQEFGKIPRDYKELFIQFRTAQRNDEAEKRLTKKWYVTLAVIGTGLPTKYPVVLRTYNLKTQRLIGANIYLYV